MLPKMRKTWIMLFLTPLFAVSCLESQYEVIVSRADCYFQYEYVNYAWGFNHYGFTITPTGEMYTFDKTTPWVFAENNQLSLAALRNNIKASVKKDTLIGFTELDYSQHLVLLAMAGKMSDTIRRGADMGETICKIIVPDPTYHPAGYREVILSQTGDTEFHNLAPQAALLAAWLTGIWQGIKL